MGSTPTIYSTPIQGGPSGTVQDTRRSTCNDDVNNSDTLPDTAHVLVTSTILVHFLIQHRY